MAISSKPTSGASCLKARPSSAALELPCTLSLVSTVKMATTFGVEYDAGKLWHKTRPV